MQPLCSYICMQCVCQKVIYNKSLIWCLTRLLPGDNNNNAEGVKGEGGRGAPLLCDSSCCWWRSDRSLLLLARSRSNANLKLGATAASSMFCRFEGSAEWTYLTIFAQRRHLTINDVAGKRIIYGVWQGMRITYECMFFFVAIIQ